MKKQHTESNAIKWIITTAGLAFLSISIFLIDQTGFFGKMKLKVFEGLLNAGFIHANTSLSNEERVRITYDVPLATLKGEQMNLAEFKGKVMFINFWASWCGPCRVEMPGIQALYEQYRDEEDIRFVMISMDEEPEKARQYLEKEGLTFGSYMLKGDSPEFLQVNGIPTTYVVNKEGVVVSKHEGIASYNTDRFRRFLDSLIKN